MKRSTRRLMKQSTACATGANEDRPRYQYPRSISRSSVTPLPLNKLAASFVNRFRAVTQPKACAAGRASLACAGRSASAAGKECLRHEATTVPQPRGVIRQFRPAPAGGPAKARGPVPGTASSSSLVRQDIYCFCRLSCSKNWSASSLMNGPDFNETDGRRGRRISRCAPRARARPG